MLSLDIGKLFGDETIPHLEDIDSSDVSLFSFHIYPVVFPAHNAAIPQAENLLDLNVRVGRLAEEVLPKLSDRFLS